MNPSFDLPRMRLVVIAGITLMCGPLVLMRTGHAGPDESLARRAEDRAPTRNKSGEVGAPSVERGAASAEPVAREKRDDGKREPQPERQDTVRRVRELIYFFRTYRVFCRDEEWAQTIRELTKIGKPAVPELVAELDRTDRTQSILSLGFTLRAIGDPRAVPALIRAIPKTLRPVGSDCGVNVVDPELRDFMQDNQNYAVGRSARSKDRLVACGRPVNEILPALERITGHREPPSDDGNDPLRGVFLGGTPEQQAAQRRMFRERQKHWEAWWGEHWDEFVTEQELQSVELSQSDDDPVEEAGLARFGPLFPTGPNVRLGPIREIQLDPSIYRDGKAYLDFDTGRTFEEYEGTQSADWGDSTRFGEVIKGWQRRNGIDAWYHGILDGIDLYSWLVSDDCWETFEDDVLSGEPLALGRETTTYLAPFGKDRTDLQHDRVGTFLFTTRDGGRGIVQVFPKDDESDGGKLHYRMWVREDVKSAEAAAAPAAEKKPGTKFGKPRTATLDMPGERKEFLLALTTGRKSAPPEFIKSSDIKPTPTKTSRLDRSSKPLQDNKEFVNWCRDKGIDAFVNITEVMYAAASGDAPPRTVLQLIGLDVLSMRVRPRAFDEMSVEKARDVLGRSPEQKSPTAWMAVDLNSPESPAAFVVKTRDGSIGLVQIKQPDKAPGKLTVTWKLHRAE